MSLARLCAASSSFDLYFDLFLRVGVGSVAKAEWRTGRERICVFLQLTEEYMMAATDPKDPTHIDKHVGSRIRMRRLMLGMSQTDMADGVALTFQQVQKYENGKNLVSAGRMQQFAKILEVPISFSLTGSGNDNPTNRSRATTARRMPFQARSCPTNRRPLRTD
jgi:transcriptional regulator with XRE-family HTH domain